MADTFCIPKALAAPATVFKSRHVGKQGLRLREIHENVVLSGIKHSVNMFAIRVHDGAHSRIGLFHT